MSLKSKIEAVIYASEEPVTLQQLAGLLADEVGGELDRILSAQSLLPLDDEPPVGFTERDADVAPLATAHDKPSTGQDEPVSPAAATASEQPIPATIAADETGSQRGTEADKRRARDRERALREHIRRAVDQLIRDYAESDRGIEIREVASGFRMGTKPEYHDAVRGFVKSLKPALKLTLPALETLAVVAYKQPVTAAEISEIRGVDSAGVLGGLMARKLIATAGRKQVIGRPMLYKTTRDFLLRFGLKDVQELPSMEEFERLAGDLVEQEDPPIDDAGTLIEQANVRGDAEHISQANAVSEAVDALQTETTIIGNENISETEATAASAAEGNHEEHSQSIQHGSTEAKTLHPAEDSEHDRTSGRTGGEESKQAWQG